MRALGSRSVLDSALVAGFEIRVVTADGDLTAPAPCAPHLYACGCVFPLP